MPVADYNKRDSRRAQVQHCMQRRKEKVVRNTESKFVFPVSVLITSFCILLCIVAYPRQCAENKGSESVQLCCLAAFLSFFFLFSWGFCCRDKDVTPQRGAPKKAKEKKKWLCSQPARCSNRWEVKQNWGRKVYLLSGFGKQKALLW